MISPTMPGPSDPSAPVPPIEDDLRLAVVIPTLDEELALPGALRSAIEAAGDPDLVCVSDGGSTDRTVEIARAAGVRVVTGPAGRGGQLDRGVRSVEGEVLLFLHADTRLPEGAGRRVLGAIAEGAVGGGFHVAYEHPGPVLSFGTRLIRWRTRSTGCPLGDQAQFVRRDVYEAMGRFRDWPILEDLDLVRRLKRQGLVALLDPPVITSSRRFRGLGLLRTVAADWLIWALYFLGVPPQRLAGLYRHVR